jgi:hypothetical protein
LLLFRHPTEERGHESRYIAPEVKIEIGSLTDQRPVGEHVVAPYLAEALAELAGTKSTSIVVLEVERTFWEKATILHNEFFRPADRPTAERMSRHFYDLAMLAGSEAGQRAMRQTEWLDRVVRHKQRFFKTGWSSFETARRGSFRLLPPENRHAALRSDYERMEEMFFNRQPAFDMIISVLGNLEQRLNS